jgi:hypothetical protein
MMKVHQGLIRIDLRYCVAQYCVAQYCVAQGKQNLFQRVAKCLKT